MIAMRPIREYDVIDLLNNGRFEGEVEGYVEWTVPNIWATCCTVWTAR